MMLWLSKPVYEVLPYFYAGAGLLLLAGAGWLNHGYWPALCLLLGLVLTTAGAFLGWKRRDFRRRH